jgi:hypothetical protein
LTVIGLLLFFLGFDQLHMLRHDNDRLAGANRQHAQAALDYHLDLRLLRILGRHAPFDGLDPLGVIRASHLRNMPVDIGDQAIGLLNR